MQITKRQVAALVAAFTVALTGSTALLFQAWAQGPTPQAGDQTKPPGLAAGPTELPALPALPAAFRKVHTLIKPGANESQVERIPWQATLWEARLKAAADGKPIFIWVTGGPPGGC
jgi:hypothetical protein